MDEYNEDGIRQQAEIGLEERLLDIELAQFQALNQNQQGEYHEFI